MSDKSTTLIKLKDNIYRVTGSNIRKHPPRYYRTTENVTKLLNKKVDVKFITNET